MAAERTEPTPLRDKPGPEQPVVPREKHEAQKAALKTMVDETLRAGVLDGLRPGQVTALRTALVTLGWMPPDVGG